jgi:hypothetical protein
MPKSNLKRVLTVGHILQEYLRPLWAAVTEPCSWGGMAVPGAGVAAELVLSHIFG